MPAQFESGFFVRVPAWHGQGNLLDHAPATWDEARKLAGLDWEPTKKPLFDRVLTGMDGEEPVYEYVEIKDYQQVVRSDTGARFAIPYHTYNIIPNAVMGELIEALAGEGARYDTAGSLWEGQKVWALMEVGDPVRIGTDPSEMRRYVAVLNSHDGTAALQAINTNVRVVCANTWKAAELDGSRTGRAYTFRHSSGWRDRLDEAKDVIAFGRKQSDLLVDQLSELARIRVTRKQMEVFVQDFVPMPVADIVSDRVVTNVESARQALRDIMASPTCEGINGTVYGLVQAAGEYLDHVRRFKTYSTYVNRTLLATEPLKARATALALDVVKR